MPTMKRRPLMHLERLESQNIYIMREVVAESERPVMMYSVEKDSAVSDVWTYVQLEQIPVASLYLAKPRPAVRREGALILVDDERMPLAPGEVQKLLKVCFRTLGCYPLTSAVESDADTLDLVVEETLATRTSERCGRAIDHANHGSMEQKKQEGNFDLAPDSWSRSKVVKIQRVRLNPALR